MTHFKRTQFPLEEKAVLNIFRQSKKAISRGLSQPVGKQEWVTMSPEANYLFRVHCKDCEGGTIS